MDNKPRVLVTRSDHDATAIARLGELCDVEVFPGCWSRSQLLEKVKGKHGLLIMPQDKVDEELLNAAGSQLKVVSTHSVGYSYCHGITSKFNRDELFFIGSTISI